MSIKSKERNSIEYFCNRCNKKRVLFIAPIIEIKDVTVQGYSELVDLHYCKENKIQVFKLHVDKHFKVRNQVAIKRKEEQDLDVDLPTIPIPKKTDYKKELIKPAKDFSKVNLYRLKIIDDMRERIYEIGEQEKGKRLSARSELELVKVEINLREKRNESKAKEWLKHIANLIEGLVILDKKELSRLILYLDNIITSNPTDVEILELDLLLNLNQSILHSSKEQLKILTESFTDVFHFEPRKVFYYFQSIINFCIANPNSTLMQIYTKLGESSIQIYSLPYFLSLVAKLINFGFINLEKLEFYST